MNAFVAALPVQRRHTHNQSLCASPRTLRIGQVHHPSPWNRTVMALPGVSPHSLRVLVVGGGGREHALASALAQSNHIAEVLVGPGNAGTEGERLRRVPLDAERVPEIVQLARSEHVDLAVIGPEVALVSGVVDELRDAGIRAFGPSGAAAALEGSKAYAKAFMERHNIPTAAYRKFDDAAAARAYVSTQTPPIVVKADGLAAGKGVVVAQTVDEALDAVDAALVRGDFGTAGRSVVIEEFLTGEEVSFFALCDGEYSLPLASAQDHKAAYDGDLGPNTGGMGAYSPAPVCDTTLARRVMDQVVTPTVKGMAAEGAPFRGVLFLGLMVGDDGDFKVLEYNVRFGDPECQVLCARMRTDMCELLYRAADGKLDGMQVEWRDEKAIVVVMASEGYPGKYEKGRVITGVEEANEMGGVTVYHAGTEVGSGGVVNNGGRVLGVTALGDTIVAARKRAYEAVDKIEWQGCFSRKDIGWRAVRREEVGVEAVK